MDVTSYVLDGNNYYDAYNPILHDVRYCVLWKVCHGQSLDSFSSYLSKGSFIDLSDRKLWTCDQVRYVTRNETALYDEFPACKLDKTVYVGVPADLRTRLHIGSLVRLTFSTATWAAIVLHTFGVELYVCLH